MGNLFVASTAPGLSETNDKKNENLKTYPKVTPSEWKQVVEGFTSQLLHPTFLPNPVRGSTVTAAEEYHPSDPNSKYLMPGNHKHLGGAYDPTDGCIYGVPAHSRTILCLYRDNDNDGEYRMKAIPLPESIRDTQFKWLRGILAHGYLWAIPAWADSVLCVDVDAYWGRREANGDEIVQLLPLPPEHKASQWQWHGAGINHEKTAIYCIPSNAKAVLKVDIPTKTTSLIPIDFDPEKHASFNLDSSNKWYGGIVGVDNAVYGIPYRTCSVLRIDCKTDTATLIGPDYGTGKYNWHGGIQANGKIFAHPSHANTVLVIDTNIDDAKVYELPIHRAPYDQDPRQNYKWLGGSLGADGNIYCPACDTSSVLKIDTTTNEVTTMGFAGTAKNKWQGGILSPTDNCIYCIPANGNQILRIATDPSIGEEKPVQLLGDLPIHKDKWQGGYFGQDGALYFIPENGYRVLKVTPPSEPPKVMDGKLPTDDVKIEMM